MARIKSIISAQPRQDFLVQFLNFYSLVILLQDLFVGRAIMGHPKGSDLAHTHAVAPSATVKRHPNDVAGRISLDVKVEQTVSQSQQRSKPEGSNRPAAS